MERIAAVEGVDVLFVGPADLAHSLGMSSRHEPELLERVEAVAVAARAHGKAAGMLVATIDQAATYRTLGFTFLGCSSDGGLLVEAARRTAGGLQQLKEVRVG